MMRQGGRVARSEPDGSGSNSAGRAEQHANAGGHRHGAGHQCRNTADQNAGVAGTGRGDADDEAGGRDDAIVGAKHGCAQPANAIGPMTLGMATP